MARFLHILSGIILLALVLTINIAGAVDPEVVHADLNVSKMVSSAGPYQINDEVTWTITLWNNGPANATNITLKEDISQLHGLKNITVVADRGEYNTTTNVWSIDELENATFATLTLKTSFSTAGIKTNGISITGLNETDPVLADNHAQATVWINVREIIPPSGTKADLKVSKIVSSTGPYDIGDEVTWLVTLRNNGPANATNITLHDDVSHLYSLKNLAAVADLGVYNTTTNIWSIDELLNGTYATLTLKTTFNTAGNKINKVDITALDETDPVLADNHAQAIVQYNTSQTINPYTPVSANLIIRPTTLNLNSKGVFTVYVTLTGTILRPAGHESKTYGIDYANSSLTCDGADLVKTTASDKEGRTLIAKFHRSDLENVTTGDGVLVTCSGTLAVNGTTIPVEGSDTIRVIGEKKGLDNILSRLFKFLGIEKDNVEITQGEDGNVTVTLHLNPDNFKNWGQAKKILKENESDTGADNETANNDQFHGGKENHIKNNADNKQIKDNESYMVANNETAYNDQFRGGIENHIKNNGDNKQIREKNADGKTDKGNNGPETRDGESSGKPNGKKDT